MTAVAQSTGADTVAPAAAPLDEEGRRPAARRVSSRA